MSTPFDGIDRGGDPNPRPLDEKPPLKMSEAELERYWAQIERRLVGPRIEMGPPGERRMVTIAKTRVRRIVR
ncbi:MAG: hypothetical protein ACRD3I_02185 [Terriglobales bacterium]